LIKGDVLGGDAAKANLRRIIPSVLDKARAVFIAEATAISGYVRTTHMSGPRPGKLGVRTGRFRGSVRPLPIEMLPGIVKGGIGFGTEYAAIHVGPKGQITEIKPKGKKFLTIPLDAAMTKAGVSRGAAKSRVYGETFFHWVEGSDGKKKLILFGKLRTMKGKRTGMLERTIVPLFLLVRSVKVPTRVHPEEIMSWAVPRIVKAFSDLKIRVTGG